MTSVASALRATAFGLLAAVFGLAGQAEAQNVARGEQSGLIQWGIWIDPDGCMHWYADGGVEQYQVNRLHPDTGMPVCLRQDLCMVADADTFFQTDSAQLMPGARARLEQVFSQPDVFGYAVYGHTDSRASVAYNQSLSERRARTVADVGRSLGVAIEREMGFGELRPRATNNTADGMRQNRRVEIVCYRW